MCKEKNDRDYKNKLAVEGRKHGKWHGHTKYKVELEKKLTKESVCHISDASHEINCSGAIQTIRD